MQMGMRQVPAAGTLLLSPRTIMVGLARGEEWRSQLLCDREVRGALESMSRGRRCRTSARVLSTCPAVVSPVVDKLPLEVPMRCCSSARICEIAR
jgi:hypothetical protein